MGFNFTNSICFNAGFDIDLVVKTNWITVTKGNLPCFLMMHDCI